MGTLVAGKHQQLGVDEEQFGKNENKGVDKCF